MMIKYSTVIQKFEQKGDKTRWTYVVVPAELAQQLKPNNKSSFRVKGKLDGHPVDGLTLLPAGGGDFILPLNEKLRKLVGKGKGATLQLQLLPDEKAYQINGELLACLEDEPTALQYFQSLVPSHQKYFSKWIEEAKTAPTKAKRIAATVDAMVRKMDFGAMIRAMRDKAEY